MSVLAKLVGVSVAIYVLCLMAASLPIGWAVVILVVAVILTVLLLMGMFSKHADITHMLSIIFMIVIIITFGKVVWSHFYGA